MGRRDLHFCKESVLARAGHGVAKKGDAQKGKTPKGLVRGLARTLRQVEHDEGCRDSRDRQVVVDGVPLPKEDEPTQDDRHGLGRFHENLRWVVDVGERVVCAQHRQDICHRRQGDLAEHEWVDVPDVVMPEPPLTQGQVDIGTRRVAERMSDSSVIHFRRRDIRGVAIRPKLKKQNAPGYDHIAQAKECHQ